jgi:hypothetical protein
MLKEKEEITSNVHNVQVDKKLLKTRVPFGLKQAFKHRRTRCFKCRSYKRYENPMAMCWECRNRFCYKHINCLQVNSKMKETDEVRYVCDGCKEEHGYRTLE